MNQDRLFAILDKIDAKLDKVDNRLNDVDVRLAKYNAELEFHIARTNQIEDALMPVVTHVEQLRGATKLVGIVAAALSLIGGLSWLFMR